MRVLRGGAVVELRGAEKAPDLNAIAGQPALIHSMESQGFPGAVSTRTGPTGDSLTILTARNGRRLAKLIRADRTILDYDSAYRYDMWALPVRCVRDLAEALAGLAHRPACCAVRGEIADAARANGVRRLLHPDPETGDGPTLRHAARA
mgnify:CR=1 FL=1